MQVLILAWKLGAQRMGYFSREEFSSGEHIFSLLGIWVSVFSLTWAFLQSVSPSSVTLVIRNELTFPA